jgi:hypothetical protein
MMIIDVHVDAEPQTWVVKNSGKFTWIGPSGLSTGMSEVNEVRYLGSTK